jgi:hypothetical protein
MAKYEEPFEDTQAIFDTVIDNAGLKDVVNISVLSNNRAKEIFKVNKASDLLKYRTGDDVYIIINEKVFEQLTDEQKMIVAEEAVAYVAYDFENDKLVITPPDFSAHSGILRKHNYPIIEVLRESIKTIYQAEKDTEEENKNTTKKGKSKY